MIMIFILGDDVDGVLLCLVRYQLPQVTMDVESDVKLSTSSSR
jgi:hypothetical protein